MTHSVAPVKPRDLGTADVPGTPGTAIPPQPPTLHIVANREPPPVRPRHRRVMNRQIIPVALALTLAGFALSACTAAGPRNTAESSHDPAAAPASASADPSPEALSPSDVASLPEAKTVNVYLASHAAWKYPDESTFAETAAVASDDLEAIDYDRFLTVVHLGEPLVGSLVDVSTQPSADGSVVVSGCMLTTAVASGELYRLNGMEFRVVPDGASPTGWAVDRYEEIPDAELCDEASAQ